VPKINPPVIAPTLFSRVFPNMGDNQRMTGYAAVVLAGGAARRLGGVDKPGLRLGAFTLLDRALFATGAAKPLVAVGPERPTERTVRWCREEPAGGGPVAALAAGLADLPADIEVAVLAADLAEIGPDTVTGLRFALARNPEADGALLVDANGRRQWLTGVWKINALRAALPAEPAGAALHAVLGRLRVVEVPARAGEAMDVDTPEDLDKARHRA
jgi:molybdopterin-guanine dinucleotide biosynthesis protein A